MYRARRYSLQNKTCYVYQSGKAGGQCFFDEGSFYFFLNRLVNCLSAYRLQLHTYALLPGEFHLLVSVYSLGGLTRMLDSVTASYDEYFVNRFQRNPFPAKKGRVQRLLTGGSMVLDCQKYIERAPVHAGLVDSPGAYPWTGYGVNGFGGHQGGSASGDRDVTQSAITMHHQYSRLHRNPSPSFQNYRDFVASPFTPAQLQFLEQRLKMGYPLITAGQTKAGPVRGFRQTT